MKAMLVECIDWAIVIPGVVMTGLAFAAWKVWDDLNSVKRMRAGR